MAKSAGQPLRRLPLVVVAVVVVVAAGLSEYTSAVGCLGASGTAVVVTGSGETALA